MNERVEMVLSRRHSSVIAKVGAKTTQILSAMVLLDVLAQDHRAFQSQQHHKHSNAPPPSRDGKNYSWKRHEDLCPGIGPNALAASDRRIYARLIAVGKGGAFQWPASPEATASAGRYGVTPRLGGELLLVYFLRCTTNKIP